MNKVLFDYCRYYKGEKECPFKKQNDRMFWDYERIWCNMQTTHNTLMNDMLRDYNLSGFAEFEPYDGTPVSLKALLFNRLTNYMEMPSDRFESFYKDLYIARQETLMEYPDELTEKMHSEFKVSKETEMKHRAMSVWTICKNNSDYPDLERICELYGITKEFALKWLQYCKDLSK